MEKGSKLECAEYDETGKCVRFRVKNGELVGYIPDDAKKCNPKGSAEAEKMIRASKVRIEVK